MWFSVSHLDFMLQVLFHLPLQGTTEEVLRLHLHLITLVVVEELADLHFLRTGLGQEGSLLHLPLPWAMATRAQFKTEQVWIRTP